MSDVHRTKITLGPTHKDEDGADHREIFANGLAIGDLYLMPDGEKSAMIDGLDRHAVSRELARLVGPDVKVSFYGTDYT